MNTRLQVEHPVTEAITGLDLVHEQIRVASGGGLSVTQEDVNFQGHAIECRINAEDPRTFVPSPGTITHFHTPGGLGIRVDSGVYSGYRIPPYYDSLIGKLIVHGRNRVECMMRLRRALDEFVVDGIKTTLPLFRDLVGNRDIANGDYDIHWLEKYLAETAIDAGRGRRMTRPFAPGYRIPTDLLLEGLRHRACFRWPKAPTTRRSSGFGRRCAASSRSMPSMCRRACARRSRQGRFDIRIDTDFAGVIDACAEEREERRSTWINAPIRRGLHRAPRPGPLPIRSRRGAKSGWSAGSTA